MPNLHIPTDTLLSAADLEEIFILAESNAISPEEAITRVQLHLESVNKLINEAEKRFTSGKSNKGSLFNYAQLKPRELKNLLDTFPAPNTKIAKQNTNNKNKPRT